ncbi:MAG: Terminase-like family protein [Thermodesulfobacteriota bacterium]
MGPIPQIIWSPQPKQAQALSCPVFELFYGGARFGGKSDYLLADFLDGIQYGQNHKGVLFRRTYNELEELLFRSRQIYPRLGGEFQETKRQWVFREGSVLKLRFLEADKDVHRYQGHQYTWIGFDELTNWPTDYPYTYMFSCARSPQGLPVRVRASGNPGSIGHSWVKGRFIDPARAYQIHRDPLTGLSRVFIPSTLDDNEYAKNDPEYEGRLKALPPHLYRAHRFGDWEVFVGQAFNWQPAYHVIKPVPIPDWAAVYMTFDWGFGAPFSVGWWWSDSDGRLYRFSEWYGWSGEINKGLRLTDSEIAQGIREREDRQGLLGRPITRIAGPDCFQKRPNYQGGGQGPSTADIFAAVGLKLLPGDANRILKLRQFHERLRIPEDGQSAPMMQIYDTCQQFIRTIPNLVVDPNHPEDLDTKGEDHIYDEACHVLMWRALNEPKETKEIKRPPRDGSEAAQREREEIQRQILEEQEREREEVWG